MNRHNRAENQSNRQRHWQAHVKTLANSGLSRADYCRQHKISYHALTYWQRKFSKPENSATTLVPVPLATQSRQPAEHSGQAGLHIILPGEISIAVGNNFSPVTLSRLLTVLENR